MSASPSLLIVDDNPALHHSMLATLSARGIAARAVISPSAAMAELERQAFDALIADIWLPENGGINLIKDVKARYPAMRIFAMTGGGPGMPIESASSLATLWGAEKVFLKPFRETELADMLG